MKVVDASALVEFLLGSAKGGRVDTAIGGDRCAAPELLAVEVASTLARLVRADILKNSAADRAVETLARTTITFVSHRDLLAPAWTLRDRVRIADGFYVACAKRLRCSLVTTDGRLSRARLPGVSIIYVQ